MRARLVYERFSEKNIDPVEAMGIGYKNQITRIFKERKSNMINFGLTQIVLRDHGKYLLVSHTGNMGDSFDNVDENLKGAGFPTLKELRKRFYVEYDSGNPDYMYGIKFNLNKVNESFSNQNFRTPFATYSSLRNNQFAGKYPLSKIQYEDVDKPEDISGEYIECEACGRSTHPKDFEAGVCKKCAAQGIWQDRDGKLHRQNSRVRQRVTYESKK